MDLDFERMVLQMGSLEVSRRLRTEWVLLVVPQRDLAAVLMLKVVQMLLLVADRTLLTAPRTDLVFVLMLKAGQMLHSLQVVLKHRMLVLKPQMGLVSDPMLKADQKLLLMTAQMHPMVRQMDLASVPKLRVDRKLLLTVAQKPLAVLQMPALQLADWVWRQDTPVYVGKHLAVTARWQPDSPYRCLSDLGAHSQP